MSRFSIGTFNLYNLILPGFDLYGEAGDDNVTFAKKCDWISAQIQQMQCEIIGFQEVFHGEALRKALEKDDFHKVHKLKNIIVQQKELETLETPNVALATSFKVLDSVFHAEIPVAAQLDFAGASLGIHQFSRPVLEVKLEVFGQKILVFVAHLKSKRGVFLEDEDNLPDFTDPFERAKAIARSLILRAQDAAGLRALIVNSLRKEKLPLLALGDFNDVESSVTTKIVSGNSAFSRPPRFIEGPFFEAALFDVHEIQRRYRGSEPYSHVHDGRCERLDHIFVSEEFLPKTSPELSGIEWSKVQNDHLLNPQNAQGISIDRSQSDHGPVVASVIWPESSTSKDTANTEATKGVETTQKETANSNHKTAASS